MPNSSDSSSPGTAPEERTPEPTIDAPVVNVWEARRKENEAKIQKAEKPLEAPSKFFYLTPYIWSPLFE